MGRQETTTIAMTLYVSIDQSIRRLLLQQLAVT